MVTGSNPVGRAIGFLDRRDRRGRLHAVQAMGFSYRKSIRLGPFRINASKAGVGWSVGTRGVRTTVTPSGRRYTTFSVPGTGLSYRTDSKQGCLVPLALGVGLGSSLLWCALRWSA